jgi:hypothetical protein
MLYEKWIFSAPSKFGHFYIAEGLNRNTEYTDWKKSKEARKIVKVRNDHSLGRKFFVKWNREACNIMHRHLYTFDVCRDDTNEKIGSRGLAKVVFEFSQDPTKPDFRGHLV